MSCAVTSRQVEDNTNKFELAKLLVAKASAPEQALKSLFTGFMQALDKTSKAKVEDSVKERVWNAVSGAKLKVLTEAFIVEICKTILGKFTDDEAGTMLEEHKSIGVVKNIEYSSHLQMAYELHQKTLKDFVVEKAKSMKKEFVSDVVAALKKEGVELPQILKV